MRVFIYSKKYVHSFVIHVSDIRPPPFICYLFRNFGLFFSRDRPSLDLCVLSVHPLLLVMRNFTPSSKDYSLGERELWCCSSEVGRALGGERGNGRGGWIAFICWMMTAFTHRPCLQQGNLSYSAWVLALVGKMSR